MRMIRVGFGLRVCVFFFNDVKGRYKGLVDEIWVEINFIVSF